MPPEPRHVPVSPSPECPARQRLHIHGIREMPAGYDAEVAELFRDLRSASSLTKSDLAARLATRVEVVQALEQGALYALPPWAETCRVVNGYGAMLNLDVRPLLRRIYAQLESGIVELGPKPIPDVPVMAGPEPVDFGRGQNKFEPKFETNNFEARPFQANSFEQKPVEPNKGAAPKPSAPTPDWPENPFAKPKPGQPQAAPKPPQGQWPQAQPASAPQQSSWPTGPGSPFQATWPNAAPTGAAQARPARRAAEWAVAAVPANAAGALGGQSLGAASWWRPNSRKGKRSRRALSLGPPRLRLHLLGRSLNSRSRLRKPIFRPRGNKRSSSSRKPALSPCRPLQPRPCRRKKSQAASADC